MPRATRPGTSRSRSNAEIVKAAVFHGQRDVRIESVPEPDVRQDDEVVLEVVRAAICGTDASEWDHGPLLCKPGVVLGHEFVGRVVTCGADVTSVHVGDRVVSGAGISCGRCPWCRSGRTNLCVEYQTLGLQVDGGLAEYVRSPASICHTVPDACTDDAAAMAQPLAVALHALSRVRETPEESVAVIGVGGIGSLVVAGASRRANGGRLVAIDIDRERLALGATEVADANGHSLKALLLELSDGVGFDVVIEASGAAHAPAEALSGTRRGGRVLLVGLHAAPLKLDLSDTILREIDVVTSVAHVCHTDIPEALTLLTENDLATLAMARTIPLDALVEEGLQPIAERRAPGKILVNPTPGEASEVSALIEHRSA